MEELLKQIKKNRTITIKGIPYLIKTKTWYSIEEDKTTSYVKCELSQNQVLVLSPADGIIYLGKVVEALPYQRVSEEEIVYRGEVLYKTGEGHQFITKIEFGKKEEVEGACIFEDFEANKKIISLGYLTERKKRADVLAEILEIDDICF